MYKPFTRVKLGVENYQPKIKSGSLCSEPSSFLSKFLASSQTLYFLFTDVELAHENINWGGFIDFKRKWVGLGKEKRLCTAFLGKLPTYPSPKTTFCPK